MRGFGKRPTGRASVRSVGLGFGIGRKARKPKLHMICDTKARELPQGPIRLRLGITLNSRPPFVLLTNQPDKQRLFQSILQPYREPQKTEFSVSRPSVPFSEQILALLGESQNLPDTPIPVPPGVREKLLPRLRCLQKVLERAPKTFVPYRTTPQYKLTYYLETLACGHQQFAYPPNHVAKRRNCIECLKLQSSLDPGAPVVSVAGGTVRGNANSVPVPPFGELPDKKLKKPNQSATESEVITRESRMG